MRLPFRHRRHGQVIVVFPVALIALLGMMSLAFDVGRYYLAQQEAQKMADAAALAAVMTWPNRLAMTESTADFYAEQNSAVIRAVCSLPNPPEALDAPNTFLDPPVRLPQPDGTTLPAPALHVSVSCQVSLIPGTILWDRPAPTLTVRADATAAQGCADPSGWVMGYTYPCPGNPPYRYGARLVS